MEIQLVGMGLHQLYTQQKHILKRLKSLGLLPVTRSVVFTSVVLKKKQQSQITVSRLIYSTQSKSYKNHKARFLDLYSTYKIYQNLTKKNLHIVPTNHGPTMEIPGSGPLFLLLGTCLGWEQQGLVPLSHMPGMICLCWEFRYYKQLYNTPYPLVVCYIAIENGP